MEEQPKAVRHVWVLRQTGQDVFINLITIAMGNLSRHAQEAPDALAVR